MRRITVALFGVLAVLSLLAGACSGGGGGGGKGSAVFAISDTAVDMGAVTSIKLTVDSVNVHAQGGAWTTVSSSAKTFDLLELRAKGTTQLMAQADLQAGTYDQMELNVSKVVVVDAKGEHEAKLPSGKLQIKGSLEVKPEATATANFDFLADQSLHVTGEGRYILAPVIQLETKADAKVTVHEADVKSNNEVVISGGTTTTSAQVGMDIEGNVDAGLRVTPDAVLSIGASGKLVQLKGQALVLGTVKAVDTANGTVTVTTKGGSELVLHIASDSKLTLKGSSTTLANLGSNIGAEVVAKYNAETKAMGGLAANGDAKAKADVGAQLDLSGTIKSVDATKGTITVTTDTGADVVLKTSSDAKLNIGGAVSSLAGLGAKVGSHIEGDYDASTGVTGKLAVETEATVKASGTIKAVDAAAGTLTVTTQGGADVALKVASDSKLLVNGSLATLATLKGMVGSDISVEYNQETKEVKELDAKLKAGTSASVSGVIKAVNPAQGTVTIATQSGQDVVLNVTANSSVVANGTIGTTADLASRLGAQVTANYDAQTKTATNVSAQGQAQAQTSTQTQAQAQAQASASGSLKAVNVLAGTITVATQGGADLVLNVSGSTKMTLNGSVSTLASLAASIGSKVTVDYSAQTNAATSVSAQSQTSATTSTQAQAQASASGTLKAVNVLSGTITVAMQGGADLVLNVSGSTKMTLNGAVSTLASLATSIGSKVTVDYNAQTNAATSVSAQSQTSATTTTQAQASASGTLKAVNGLAATVTVATQGGADLVTNVSGSTKVMVNDSSSTLASLATSIGSRATVEYNAQTNAATSVSVIR